MSSPPPARSRVIIRTARDVTNVINSGASPVGHARAITFIALGGIFIDAYDFTAISFGLGDISKQFQLSPLAEGVVGASIMVGALLGALIGGYLVDRLGRYKVFMADMLFFVVAALVCAVAPNVEILTAARFLMGFGIGMDFPVALAFIAEFSALRGRGGRVTLWQPMWYIATATGFLILVPLYFVIPADAHGSLWRWAVGFGALPALVVMLVRRRYMDESPLWAANRGDLARAAEILRKSYGVDAVAEQADAHQQPTSHRPVRGEFRQLFSARYLPRTVLSSTVAGVQSMQYYAVGFALPAIITNLLAQGTLTSIVGSLVFNAVFGITGGALGVWLAGRWGSWRLSTIGFAVCAVTLLALGFIGRPSQLGLAILVGLLIGTFVFFHSSGPGAQGMTMATLSYPTSLRGVGTGFAQGVLRIGSTISLLLFPVLSKHLGTGVFFVVALAPAVGLLTLLLIRWEPVGADVDADDHTQLSTAQPGQDTTRPDTAVQP
jgi:predicted MFS family arabinose efflux permease